jgi:hypothetical protein
MSGERTVGSAAKWAFSGNEQHLGCRGLSG